MLVNKQGWPMEKLPRPIEILYADGGKNPEATATHFCKVIAKVNGLETRIRPLVTRLDKSILYLGYDWLVGANPKIDWRMSCIARITMDQTHDCLTEKVDRRTSQIGRIAPDQTPDYLTEFMDIFSDT